MQDQTPVLYGTKLCDEGIKLKRNAVIKKTNLHAYLEFGLNKKREIELKLEQALTNAVNAYDNHMTWCKECEE